jgi:hypothetical protein
MTLGSASLRGMARRAEAVMSDKCADRVIFENRGHRGTRDAMTKILQRTLNAGITRFSVQADRRATHVTSQSPPQRMRDHERLNLCELSLAQRACSIRTRKPGTSELACGARSRNVTACAVSEGNGRTLARPSPSSVSEAGSRTAVATTGSAVIRKAGLGRNTKSSPPIAISDVP